MNSISGKIIRFSKSYGLIYNLSKRHFCFSQHHTKEPIFAIQLLTNLQKRRYCNASENAINLDNPDVQSYISSIVEEYKSLQQSDDSSSGPNAKERIAELSQIVALIDERKALVADSAELKSMKDESSSDDELKNMLSEEMNTYHEKIQKLDAKIIENLVPADPQENNGAVLEVSAGVGGKEAMLFSRELFDMYCNYITYRGWNMEIVLMDSTEMGGLRHSSALVSGRGPVYGLLSQEAGVHRVQRIPITERSGRIHTSTVRVAVLLQPSELDVQLKKEDLRIETKRAGGAGGQHVNTTDSAVRITHIPSGVFVDCQTDRSQYRNKELALQRLRAKLYESEKAKRDRSVAASRKEQIGDAARSEKIRTYNFGQDRITDHRISRTLHNLEDFLQGKESLDSLMTNLYKKGKEDKLIQVLKSVR